MEDLDKDEVVQLVAFYKQKLSDAELELLKLQIKLNKLNTYIAQSSATSEKKSK